MADQTVQKILDLMESEDGPDPEKIKQIIAEATLFERRIVDRIEWIKDTDSIKELRRRIKVAHAKKSKSKEAPKSLKRYEKEVQSGNNRLNELLAQAGDYILRLIQLDEEPQRVLTKWLELKEEELKMQLETFQIPAKTIKELTLRMSAKTPETLEFQIRDLLGEDTMAIYNRRLSKNDQRVVSLNRRIHLVLALIEKPDIKG